MCGYLRKNLAIWGVFWKSRGKSLRHRKSTCPFLQSWKPNSLPCLVWQIGGGVTLGQHQLPSEFSVQGWKWSSPGEGSQGTHPSVEVLWIHHIPPREEWEQSNSNEWRQQKPCTKVQWSFCARDSRTTKRRLCMSIIHISLQSFKMQSGEISHAENIQTIISLWQQEPQWLTVCSLSGSCAGFVHSWHGNSRTLSKVRDLRRAAVLWFFFLLNKNYTFFFFFLKHLLMYLSFSP